jgi:DNA-binding response OmpR family regulator
MTQTNESKGAGSRILIVDDDVHTLDILRRWLTREGYRTLCADGGAACLDLLDQEGQGEADIDVIILDVMMPGIDGLQVCEQLRDKEAWRGIPIMLLTAKDDMETRARGMTLGVSEYLTKPVNKKEFLTRLEAQIHNRSLQHQLARMAAAIENASKK